MTNVLEIRDLSLRIGGTAILDGVDLVVANGELVALIGPNGAGKTSLLNCVCGLYRPDDGWIRVHGRAVSHLPPHVVARAGVGRTFQHAELFPALSVIDNVLLGRHRHFRTWALVPRPGEEATQRARVEPVLRFLELDSVRNVPAGDLPYGRQKVVGLARALASQPEVLLLDEPSAGMHAHDRAAFARILLRIKRELGIPMLWIEHDMELVSEVAGRVAVLDAGRMIATGAPHTVLRDPHVVRAYLGAVGSPTRRPDEGDP